MLSMKELELLKQEVENCKRCNLYKTRTNIVFGDGNPEAKLMLVGEAPGYYEDKKGLPFVGSAGKLLDTLLGEIGLSRNKVYIANVLKCRPPNNRDPKIDEIERCSPYLFAQISYISPKIIITLGNHSTRLLTEIDIGITKVHGRVFKKGEKIVMPTFHPAACLYHPEWLKLLREDLSKIPSLLSECNL
ncbi:MAG: uracil-DNA glycosylase [bacterium]|nr:uracil-DNA glycosylase [bacterium]